MRDGAVVELDDGATLEMSTIEVETLSKSSIVRALGRVAGDKLIESLRKKGVIEKDKRERMMPRKS